MSFNLEACKYDFASDNINIFINLYDQSGSMDNYVATMRKANKAFYNDFSRFEERGSIAISKAVFSDGFEMSSFGSVSDFDVSYNAYGNTALYNAIIRITANSLEYYKESIKRLNVRPKVTLLVFSDGEDNCGDENDFINARDAIKELNSIDATTVFVAFGNAVSAGIGEKLGFTCIKNITSAQELISCMGSELSKSCKEQSRSAYSLKSEFFSQAEKDSDQDEIDAQSITDDDFFTGLL